MRGSIRICKLINRWIVYFFPAELGFVAKNLLFIVVVVINLAKRVNVFFRVKAVERFVLARLEGTSERFV